MECAHECVAQSVEHVTFNHGVVGSIPTALTSKINGLCPKLKLNLKLKMRWGNVWGNET
jgi:hypothetical protein